MDPSVDKNGDESGGSSGNEVTAEWIVRAQLKITQPKKKKAASFASGDCGARRSSGSPCRIVYKWTSDETKLKEEKQTKSLKNNKNNNNNVEKVSRENSLRYILRTIVYKYNVYLCSSPRHQKLDHNLRQKKIIVMMNKINLTLQLLLVPPRQIK